MVIYVQRVENAGGDFVGPRTGEVLKVDTEAYTAVRVAEFEDRKDAEAFLRAWNGEETPNA
jgi:hypothetical protein